MSVGVTDLFAYRGDSDAQIISKTKPHPINDHGANANQCNVDRHIGRLANQSRPLTCGPRALEAAIHGMQPTIGSKFARRCRIAGGRDWRPSRRGTVHGLPPVAPAGRVQIWLNPKYPSSPERLFLLTSTRWVCMFVTRRRESLVRSVQRTTIGKLSKIEAPIRTLGFRRASEQSRSRLLLPGMSS